MPTLKSFMALYHKLSDKDFVWFPFLFLRPRPEQSIGFRRYVVMGYCFGLYGSLLWPLKQLLWGEGNWTWNGWAVFTAKSLAFFYLWFAVVTIPLWNQRARALNN